MRILNQKHQEVIIERNLCTMQRNKRQHINVHHMMIMDILNKGNSNLTLDRSNLFHRKINIENDFPGPPGLREKSFSTGNFSKKRRQEFPRGRKTTGPAPPTPNPENFRKSSTFKHFPIHTRKISEEISKEHRKNNENKEKIQSIVNQNQGIQVKSNHRGLKNSHSVLAQRHLP